MKSILHRNFTVIADGKMAIWMQRPLEVFEYFERVEVLIPTLRVLLESRESLAEDRRHTPGKQTLREGFEELRDASA